MKLEYLLKNLTEEIAMRSEVVHHTTLEALAGILDFGIIMPNIYAVSSRSGIIGGDRKDRELATLRRSVDRGFTQIRKKSEENYKEKLEDLTENSGDVKIYLFNRNITSKLRGVSKKPISEYGKENEIRVKDATFMLYRVMRTYKAVDKKRVEKFVGDFRKDISEIYSVKSRTAGRAERIGNSKKEFFKEISSAFGFDDNEKNKIEKYFDELAGEIIRAERDHKEGTREGEERLIFKSRDTRGIPVSPEFMKIRIIRKFTVNDFIRMRDWDGIDFSVKELRANLIKYKKTFLIDKNYNYLVSAIDEFIEKEDWKY
jgi:hypothetical protein